MTHLDQAKNDDLLSLLQRHAEMFDGTLGAYPHKKFHIDIDPKAKPTYARSYPVPRIHLNIFKNEIEHLIRIGVLV